MSSKNQRTTIHQRQKFKKFTERLLGQDAPSYLARAWAGLGHQKPAECIKTKAGLQKAKEHVRAYKAGDK